MNSVIHSFRRSNDALLKYAFIQAETIPLLFYFLRSTRSSLIQACPNETELFVLETAFQYKPKCICVDILIKLEKGRNEKKESAGELDGTIIIRYAGFIQICRDLYSPPNPQKIGGTPPPNRAELLC